MTPEDPPFPPSPVSKGVWASRATTGSPRLLLFLDDVPLRCPLRCHTSFNVAPFWCSRSTRCPSLPCPRCLSPFPGGGKFSPPETCPRVPTPRLEGERRGSKRGDGRTHRGGSQREGGGNGNRDLGVRRPERPWSVTSTDSKVQGTRETGVFVTSE